MSCNLNCRQGYLPEWVWALVSRAMLLLSAFAAGVFFHRFWSLL